MSENNEKPLVSIITVCYNSEKHIRDTVESVLNQTYTNIEYVVVDGESNDNTLNIVKEYESEFNGRMKLISESDEGIYDAMNKGVDIASGDWIYFLGSDDILKSGVFNNIFMEPIKKADILYGNVFLYKKDNNEYMNVSYPKKSINKLNLLLGTGICHQGMISRKKLFTKKFNTEYKICADTDWLLFQYLEKKSKFQYKDIIFSYYNVQGLSSNNSQLKKEYFSILNKYYPSIFVFLKKIIEKIKEM